MHVVFTELKKNASFKDKIAKNMNHKNYSFSRVIHRFRADPLIKYIKKKKDREFWEGSCD